MHYLQPFNPFGLFQGLFIPEGIARSRELSHAAKLTYGRLLRYAGRDGRCFPAVSSLAREIGVEVRMAQRYLSELETIHLIRRVARKRPDGGNTSNAIEFLWHKLLDGDCIPPSEIEQGGALILPSQTTAKLSGHEESHIEESHLKLLQQPGHETALGDWPETVWAVVARFEGTDDRFIWGLINDSLRAVLSFDGNLDELTDHALAGIIRDAIEENPKGRAGLLLTTVPAIIENRIKRGKRELAASEARTRRQPPPRHVERDGGPFPPQE